jgi:hypothetical protein
MICPSCNKFAPNELGEPELELDAEAGIITGNCRIVITSGCCGDELKESNFEVEIDLADKFDAAIREHLKLAGDVEVDLSEWEFEITDETPEATDRSETTSKHTKKDGTVVEKPIPYRYQKRFYGAYVQVTVTATKDDASVSVDGEWSDEVPASGMDELT